ncbi:MAG: phosphatidylinositol-specific phospholipase C [Bacteroidaceae bacterium]|nr:phosphatidylinositol-specific phospholipase C [Bacteroidaceae bacterium]
MKKLTTTFFAGLIFCMMQSLGVLQAWADNEAWMAGVPDNTFVGQLSIPGSHDAGTGHGVNNVYVIINGSTYAVTQELNLTQQWNSGIRAFDLRPAVSNNRLRIHHGIVSTNLYFDDALTTLCNLLDQHPTEMCVVIMRHETEADDSNSSWNSLMATLLNSAPTSTHAVNYDPLAKLGDMRGKLLILSRDTYDTDPIGGYITGWGFSPDFNNQKGGKIRGIGIEDKLYVQDYYDVSASGAPETKKASVERMLQFSTSENTDPGLWVINQTSGYSKTQTILSYTLATSNGYRDNAQTQNAAAATYINNHPGSTGIILMDFAGEDNSGSYNVKGQTLTNAIIANNTRPGPHADYFNALGDITAGNQYCITTMYAGTKYYLTTSGTLTDDAMDAGIFTFSRVKGAAYAYGFNLLNAYFTNPTQTNGNVTYNSGRIRTDASSKRADWEAQVFFKNASGQYAIRATNAVGTGNWEAAARTFWTVNSGTNGPVAEYSNDMNYIWNVEAPASDVTVTFNIYYGGKKVKEVTAVCQRNSTAALPDEYIHDFCTYTYSPKTITSGSVRVTVRWANGPFQISTATSTKWYNLKAGRLQRYVGWEDREPYHPHAYDEASVETYPETELYATNLVRASDAYQWAFFGNPIEGFQIVNKLMGDSKSLTVSGTATSVQGTAGIKNAVLRDGDFRWTAHANNAGFSLSLDGYQDYFINTHGGPHGYLQIWENSNAKSDLGSQLVAEAVPAASVPLTHIGSANYGTLCLPYDVTVSGPLVYVLEKGNEEPEGLSLPIFMDSIQGGEALAPALHELEGNFVLLTLVEDGVVPAGTPVVLAGRSETVSLAYGNGFTSYPLASTGLRGTFVPVTEMPSAPVSVLTLQAQDDVPGFYAFNVESIEPNQAYLQLVGQSVDFLEILLSDNEDGISSLLSPQNVMGDKVFNLAGQRMSKMQKGINIIGGKKFVVK